MLRWFQRRPVPLSLTLRDRHRVRAKRGPMTGSAVVSKGEALAQVFKNSYAIALLRDDSGLSCAVLPYRRYPLARE